MQLRHRTSPFPSTPPPLRLVGSFVFRFVPSTSSFLPSPSWFSSHTFPLHHREAQAACKGLPAVSGWQRQRPCCRSLPLARARQVVRFCSLPAPAESHILSRSRETIHSPC